MPYPALAAAVKAGYAAAGTESGHVGGNADFVPGHPEKLVDFAYRAIHEMTVSAKTVVAAHYDARPVRSYFSSCSTGGRQALIEAQRSRKTSTASSPAMRPGIRCASMRPGSR